DRDTAQIGHRGVALSPDRLRIRDGTIRGLAPKRSPSRGREACVERWWVKVKCPDWKRENGGGWWGFENTWGRIIDAWENCPRMRLPRSPAFSTSQNRDLVPAPRESRKETPGARHS